LEAGRVLDRAAPPDEATLRAALPAWLDRIAPSIRAFVAHCVVEAWPSDSKR